MIAFIFFAISIVILNIMDPNWSFGKNALSEMGVSSMSDVKMLFAVVCVITGILVIGFGLGKVLFEKDYAFISGLLTIAAGISMILVAAYPADIQPHHNIAAGLLAIFMAGAIITATVNDILGGSRNMLIIGIVIGVIALLTSFLPLGYAQLATVMCGMVWFIIHFAGYYRRGFESYVPDDCAVKY